jgi:hypothetical protein
MLMIVSFEKDFRNYLLAIRFFLRCFLAPGREKGNGRMVRSWIHVAYAEWIRASLGIRWAPNPYLQGGWQNRRTPDVWPVSRRMTLAVR